ncbi:MAG TPA: hypothetical protein VFJ85_08700 [Acidimicrobiales bacterium]|nr:hypothetical protein [Acidimicrobiales bacterium]
MPAPGRFRELFTFRRVVSTVLLTLAGVGFVYAFTLHDDSPNPRLRPAAVRTVSPAPGALQVRQTDIFVELDPGYRASLVVNGVAIPDDQVDVIGGLNRYTFTPGKDREVKRLEPGQNCAIVSFALAVGGGDPGEYQWCFTVS